jgi:ABC-type nitrate/sulfonate/bicarbonate transport system substrate-binding protein
MRRKRAAVRALGLLLLAGIFLSCSRKAETIELTVNKEGQQVYQIKTWTNVDCTAAPYIVAEHLNLFKEVGIELIYTGETQGPQKIPSILSGDNDVGTGHPNTVALARQGGATIRGIARSIIEPPESITDIHLQHMWWVSDKNGPIQKLEDVKKLGRKLKLQLIQRNTCTDFLTDILWQNIGFNRDQVEYITIPDVEGVQALKQGLVDIATPHPPFFQAIEETGISNILTTSRQIAGEAAGTYLYYFTDDFIKKNPEPIKLFVKAIKKAERWANDNPAQTAKWTEEAIGVPVRANHYYARNAVIDDAQIQLWIDGCIASGALPKDTKITVGDVITHEFDQFGNE